MSLAPWTLHRVYTKQKQCLIWKASIVHAKGKSCRRSWTGKPCWVAKTHFGLKAWYGWRDCVFPFSPVFTSPQNQSFRPLSLLTSLDCPWKPFLLLRGTLLPLRANTHIKDLRQGDSCPSQFSHLVYNVALTNPFSSCLKSVKNERAKKTWFYHSVIELFLHLLKHILKQSLPF